MYVKKYNTGFLEPYLGALKRREKSIEEIAKETGRNWRSVKRTLTSIGSIVPLRLFIGVEEERRRLEKLLHDRRITKTEYEQRVKELLQKEQEQEQEQEGEEEEKGKKGENVEADGSSTMKNTYVCEGCNSKFEYSIFIEKTGYCYDCINRGKCSRGRTLFPGIF